MPWLDSHSARRFRIACFAVLPFLAAADAPLLHWQLIDAHTTASMRGIHRAAGSVWASGADGTVLRSADDGKTWQSCPVPPGAAKLDFRAVWAWDARRAIVMSSGPGDQSRLFLTHDACGSWQPGPVNPDSTGFWDALVFHGDEGVILGDPVDGRFVILRSHDAGLHWTKDESPRLAALLPGEGAFAASNSVLFSIQDATSRRIWFGTSGPAGPRVFLQQDSLDWVPAKVSLAASTPASGVFSLFFRDSQVGVAVGGNYEKPNDTAGTAAFSTDGGRTWFPAAHPPSGYRSAVAWDPTQQLWITVGTNGADFSRDDGKTWQHFDSGSWNALSLPWAVGPHGRLAQLLVTN